MKQKEKRALLRLVTNKALALRINTQHNISLPPIDAYSYQRGVCNILESLCRRLGLEGDWQKAWDAGWKFKTQEGQNECN